jgi:hypothetical protein
LDLGLKEGKGARRRVLFLQENSLRGEFLHTGKPVEVEGGLRISCFRAVEKLKWRG